MVPLALVPALLLPLAAGAPPAKGAELYRPLMSAVLRNVDKGGTVVVTSDEGLQVKLRHRLAETGRCEVTLREELTVGAAPTVVTTRRIGLQDLFPNVLSVGWPWTYRNDRGALCASIQGSRIFRERADEPPKPEQWLTVCLAEERAALEVASFLGAAAVSCGATALQMPGG
jgi:hypothetical protein